VTGYSLTSDTVAWDANGTFAASKSCPIAGQKVLGGGVNLSSDQLVLLGSYPIDSSHWYAVVKNTDPSNTHDVTIYVICANVS
jgi:hypothetical protein